MNCPRCNTAANENLRHCTTCQADLGFPNVRASRSPETSGALAKRFSDARQRAAARKVRDEFDQLVDVLRSSSHVVVAMPAFAARGLFFDSRNLYSNYEALVGTPTRTPAPFADDSARRAVSGKLFGSYAGEIHYGVLSLDARGLANYGCMFLRLRDIAVEDRTSFLNENSFIFLKDLRVTETIPPGFTSDWAHRCELGAAKLEPTLSSGSTVREWSEELVKSGASRSIDSCIEAHIYGPFDAAAVENVVTTNAGASHQEKADIGCIKDLLGARCLIGGVP